MALEPTPTIEDEDDGDENCPQIVVRIPLPLAKKCWKAAAKEGMTEGEYIRKAIRRGIDAWKGDQS